MEPDRKSGAQRLARWTGGWYLLLILIGAPGMVLFPRLIVAGDAAATTANISANESVVLLTFAGYVSSVAGYLVVMGLLYELLRLVRHEIAVIMVLFGATGCILSAASMVLVKMTLTAGSAWHVAALGPAANADLTLFLTEMFRGMFDTSMIFFGFQCILTGWLFWMSALIPRPLSLLLIAGGVGYLGYLFPPLVEAVFPVNVLPGYLAELVLTLWLLLKGIDAAALDRQE